MLFVCRSNVSLTSTLMYECILKRLHYWVHPRASWDINISLSWSIFVVVDAVDLHIYFFLTTSSFWTSLLFVYSTASSWFFFLQHLRAMCPRQEHWWHRLAVSGTREAPTFNFGRSRLSQPRHRPLETYVDRCKALHHCPTAWILTPRFLFQVVYSPPMPHCQTN